MHNCPIFSWLLHNVSLNHNLLLSAGVFGEARWTESRRMCMPLDRAIESEALVLTPSTSGR
jgi:hypothetical protein